VTVLNTVKNRARAISSGTTEDDLDASSRVSARERLQLLGIGDGTLTRFPAQSLPEGTQVASGDSTASDSTGDYPDISEMYLDTEDRTGRWEAEAHDLSTAVHSRESGQSESFPHINLAPTSPAVNQAREVAAKRRRSASAQLKHFHTYSISLVAVLVCSIWMFGYAMLS